MVINPIHLEIFKELFASVAEEMGTVLRRSSFSLNIKERRDFSCAIFDPHGALVAQASHIPVHLGAMPLSVESILTAYKDELLPGDSVILNDPFRGGTHLPDITLVSPVFSKLTAGISAEIIGYVATRAHHSDVGGMTPGSMPLAKEIFQEGIILPPIKVLKGGILVDDVIKIILANVRTPIERHGDLMAQIASIHRGAERLCALVSRYGSSLVYETMQSLISYSEKATRTLLSSIPDGEYSFTDFLDDDGLHPDSVLIKVKITIDGDEAIVDFTGSAPQQATGVNAVFAITLSAVAYVFRCLLALDVPNNQGCMKPIRIIAPAGTIVNASPPAAVAGGNVETSQRIVDVLFGALSKACPEIVPAASQGTMNNLTIGGSFTQGSGLSTGQQGDQYTYYETIGGGSGATNRFDGASAIHSHMTNTLNTPIEALEYSFPFRVKKYAIRKKSGGTGRHKGGDGIIKEILILADCQGTLLAERRKIPPYGLSGGKPGVCGEDYLIRHKKKHKLPSKGTFDLHKGDILCIETPGGGGFGEEK